MRSWGPAQSLSLDLRTVLRTDLSPPPQVWTALLNYGYVGCIRDLFVDGQSKDIRRLAEAQRAVGVKPSCSREPPKQCLSNPCQHNGHCREGWNRYVCDCSGTGYLGRSCERGKTGLDWTKPLWSGLQWTRVEWTRLYESGLNCGLD